MFTTKVFHRYSTRRYLDRRTWKQHLVRKRQNWEPVLPSLAKLYMEWKYSATTPTLPMDVDSQSTAPPLENLNFSLEAFDIYTLETSVNIIYSVDDLPIQALMKSGYLGNSPAFPSLAISLRTLELFRRIRLRKPSFSVEGFVKVVCDVYSVQLSHYLSPTSTDEFYSR